MLVKLPFPHDSRLMFQLVIKMTHGYKKRVVYFINNKQQYCTSCAPIFKQGQAQPLDTHWENPGTVQSSNCYLLSDYDKNVLDPTKSSFGGPMLAKWN